MSNNNGKFETQKTNLRILFIIKNYISTETVRSCLIKLSEKDSIYFVHTFSQAKDFINNNVIKNKIELDLIITQNNIEGLKAIDFFISISKDKSATFSKGDFYFHTIPVVLIVDEDENKNAFLKEGFSDVLDNVGLEKLYLFNPNFVSVVKEWRRKVLDDLENLGIRFNSGKIDHRYLLSKQMKKADTYIIAENFRLFPRRLDYPWLNENNKQIEVAIDKFIKELKRAYRLGFKRDEKRFHALFNRFPNLIQRDNYSQKWYEVPLRYDGNRSFQPDFSLKPNFNQHTDLSILEIKLPNEGFIAKSPFHPGPLQSLMSHIFQVNDYKDYLESKEYNSEIKKVFGFIPNKIEYNILMGRIEEKEKSLKTLNKRMNQINADYINLITFDELLEYQVQYFDRMRLLKIV